LYLFGEKRHGSSKEGQAKDSELDQRLPYSWRNKKEDVSKKPGDGQGNGEGGTTN
jgi:hypothetical protein